MWLGPSTTAPGSWRSSKVGLVAVPPTRPTPGFPFPAPYHQCKGPAIADCVVLKYCARKMKSSSSTKHVTPTPSPPSPRLITALPSILPKAENPPRHARRAMILPIPAPEAIPIRGLARLDYQWLFIIRARRQPEIDSSTARALPPLGRLIRVPSSSAHRDI